MPCPAHGPPMWPSTQGRNRLPAAGGGGSPIQSPTSCPVDWRGGEEGEEGLQCTLGHPFSNAGHGRRGSSRQRGAGGEGAQAQLQQKQRPPLASQVGWPEHLHFLGTPHLAPSTQQVPRQAALPGPRDLSHTGLGQQLQHLHGPAAVLRHVQGPDQEDSSLARAARQGRGWSGGASHSSACQIPSEQPVLPPPLSPEPGGIACSSPARQGRIFLNLYIPRWDFNTRGGKKRKSCRSDNGSGLKEHKVKLDPRERPGGPPQSPQVCPSRASRQLLRAPTLPCSQGRPPHRPCFHGQPVPRVLLHTLHRFSLVHWEVGGWDEGPCSPSHRELCQAQAVKASCHPPRTWAGIYIGQDANIVGALLGGHCPLSALAGSACKRPPAKLLQRQPQWGSQLCGALLPGSAPWGKGGEGSN